MKHVLLFLCLIPLACFSQTQTDVINGPELNNNKDHKMNRIIDGDKSNYYAYRVRTKGKGTSFYIEKYGKADMKLIFSQEVELADDHSIVENVLSNGSDVFLFMRTYDKEGKQMSLSYQTVSSTGQASLVPKEIMKVETDHYEFIDFDINQNPGRTRFLVKACYKGNKEDEWKTDFILLNSKDMAQVWKKTVNEKLIALDAIGRAFFAKSGWRNMGSGIGYVGMTTSSTSTSHPERDDLGLVGLLVDDEDNIYYGFSTDGKDSKADERHYKLSMYTLESAANAPKQVELVFPQSYFVRDVMITKLNGEIVIGGFIKDVIKRKGRDPIKSGVFSFKINPVSNSVVSQAIQIFDNNLLEALGSSEKDRDLRYKMDYIFNIGTDIFYVGEEYKETYVVTTSTTGNGMGGPGTPGYHTGAVTGSVSHSQSHHWEYEYRDVLVCKLNNEGKFVWIKNSPTEVYVSLSGAHLLRQYIAIPTKNNIYILCNEHPKNMELYNAPKFDQDAMKGVRGIHGSNFVCSSISLTDGAFHHSLIFKNEDFCFAPIQEKDSHFMPPPECENFVLDKPNEAIIYTEDRGLGRFSRLVFK